MSALSINNVIGERFIELLSVESTNNYAMRQVQNELAKNGDAYFAYEQTAGKGQFNKQWVTNKGENIILTIVLHTDVLPVEQQPLLNMAVALSALKLFNNYTTEKATIKWPNDIYWRDRKAAGILIENIIRGSNWQYAIIGVGMNVNQVQFPNLKNPVSLKQITGKTFDVVTLAKELCKIMNEEVVVLFSGKADKILNDYNSQLYKLNEDVSFQTKSGSISGTVKKVNAAGELIIDINNEEKAFTTGTLEWINP